MVMAMSHVLFGVMAAQGAVTRHFMVTYTWVEMNC